MNTIESGDRYSSNTISPLSPANQNTSLSNSRTLSIIVQHVSKHYGTKSHGKWALNDVSFTIEPGVFGLLGRNGAGKTTLLQLLSTLLTPTTGNIQIGPYDVQRDRWQIRALLGFLPQEQGFYPQLTVQETVRYMAVLQKLDHVQQQVHAVLEMVNLSDRMRSKVGALSGGMRRRLGLALALLGDPRVLIVDEPTTGLDPVEQQRFRMLLGTLGAQGNRIILLSTHIVADVATVARQLAVLEQGRLAFYGSVRDLAARARGHSWLWHTTIEEVEAARRAGPIIITSLTPATDQNAASNQVIARVEGLCPSPTAVQVEPTLEDGYFSIIGGTERDGDNEDSLATKIRRERQRRY